MTHPPHFTKESPQRYAPGVPFVEEVFPEPGTVLPCRARHTWHPLARGWFAPVRCCQCGVRSWVWHT